MTSLPIFGTIDIIVATIFKRSIKKSGKHTYGCDKFWSGTAGKALKGLEVGCLGFVDVEAATALHAVAVQTPPAATMKRVGKTLVSHYVSIIKNYIRKLKNLSRYLVVDGYFMKRDFITPVLKKDCTSSPKPERMRI